jgi:hypothetical protein
MSEPQEQGSEQLGGLLDAEAQRQAEQQGDQGEQQQTAPTVESLQAQLTDMQSQFQSEVDRRVNQVVSTLRSEMARAQQAPPPQQQGAPPPQQQVSGGQSTSADLREAQQVSAGGKPDAGSSYAKGAAMAKEIGRGKPPAG